MSHVIEPVDCTRVNVIKENKCGRASSKSVVVVVVYVEFCYMPRLVYEIRYVSRLLRTTRAL